MIKFTSIIPMPEEKTPLSLDWANKNFEPTYQGGGYVTYLIDVTKDCRLARYINKDGSECWQLTICFATFKVKYIEEVDCLIKTFYVNVKRKETLDK